MAAVPFRLDTAAAALTRTPAVLRALLASLPADWLDADDGPGTWTPRQVVAHLIDGERTDWTVRARRMLAESNPQFVPYDRDASLADADRQTIADLLDAFADARAGNVTWLRATVTPADLGRTGVHPGFGVVTLRQLLATWVAHDHGHIVQIARTLARASRDEVGPWAAYLSVIGATSR
ncbi:DinB family protein [Rubrivirga sp. IMCC43871]|uniref:DinB family protein n=1 Tax=Rubrivirga sp. IMCC43871 TaxID=3391575 RepID=UPI00398F9FAD